jgi:signal transduction histidine kinase
MTPAPHETPRPSDAPAAGAARDAVSAGSGVRRGGAWRRASHRLGLQGKLVICFMLLLTAALGFSSFMFLRQSSKQIADVIGEQARQTSIALALATRESMARNNADELTRTGRDLLRSRNILYVGFLDVANRPVALASRQDDFKLSDLGKMTHVTESLMQVRPKRSDLFGDHLEMVAPILNLPPASADPFAQAGTRLLGYVIVGVSQSREQAELRHTSMIVSLVGCSIAFLSLPMAYLLVHRIFFPIRQLVDATHKIAGGDLDAEVAIDRPDVIGTLARSFNEMVKRVKRQQDALEDANDRLADANRDLEEKVQVRTGQLEAANKRLSSEIAEKEDFLRAVSHDLNAPLRNIAGMATMLLMKNRDKFDADVVHRLERIQKNVQVETDLIAELLELSRIKTRRQKMEVVELGDLVAEVGEVFDEDLRTRGIALVVDTPLPALTCERARLRQVFQNLVDNAIKYMGDGPVREIHVGCVPRPGEAEFYVRDTGIGIDPEDLDKVFFVFRRGKNCTAQNIAGKGVGLASVKSIIETYSGTIWIESVVGHGSTFRFTINGQYVPLGTPGAAASGGTAPLAA